MAALSQSFATSRNNSPNFMRLFEEYFEGKVFEAKNFKTALDEIYLTAAERGLSDGEFALLLHFFCESSIGADTKRKLLIAIVPASVCPSHVMKKFMVWFISNYKKNINLKLNKYILQWLIGLVEHDLMDSSVIDMFYYQLFTMLKCKYLVKYACKLICRTTRPNDVSTSCVKLIWNKLQCCGDADDKYLQAVLNLFKGYRPRLVADKAVKKVDTQKVLNSVPQSMIFFIKLGNRRHARIIPDGLAVVERIDNNFKDITNNFKVSSLLPVPAFNLEDSTSVFPTSIKGAFKDISIIPIPQQVLTLLRNETGFFLLTYGGKELQLRLSDQLFRVLQSVFIDEERSATEDDKEYLLSRVHQFQTFINQGMPCVSLFLAGYLLNWNGLDYRSQILSLVEWATFDSFTELSFNILWPLYLLYVSESTYMKRQILEACTNLIKNMFVGNVGRVSRNVVHPFLQAAPKWTSDPLKAMLEPMVSWVERLIAAVLCTEPDNSVLLHCVEFYEMMNVLESKYLLPMWTIISRAVVYRSLIDMNPVILNRVCRLLLKYQTVFLPQLRTQQPDFYFVKECEEKIQLVVKYARDIMNFLWNEQASAAALTFHQGKSDNTFLELRDQQKLNADSVNVAFDLQSNLTFLPYIVVERQKNGHDFLKNKIDYLALLGFYTEDIKNFIQHFQEV